MPDGTLAGATDWANTVAFSPDGRSLAAGTSDASVLVWNMATRAITATLNQPQPVTTVTWDGTGPVAASDADGTASLWSLPTPVLHAGNSSTSVAYSPDGKTLAVGGTACSSGMSLPARCWPPSRCRPACRHATAFSPTG